MPTASTSISVSDWNVLEQSGCVFLPYVGCVMNLWSTRGWWYNDECTSPTVYLTSDVYTASKVDYPIIIYLTTFNTDYIGKQIIDYVNGPQEFINSYAAIRLVVDY